MQEKFVLPNDFAPDFFRVYPDDDDSFVVWVQYKGPIKGSSVYKWIFAITVGTTIVQAETFHWHLPENEFRNQDVALHLATTYRHRDRSKNPVAALKVIPKESNQSDDEIFVLKAIALVWSIFYSDKPSYPMEELFVDSYSSVLGNKCALISCKSNPAMSYEVAYSKSNRKTYVTSYVEVDKYEFTEEELQD